MEIVLGMIEMIVRGTIVVLEMIVRLDRLDDRIVPSAPLNVTAVSRRSTMLLLNL